MLTIIATFTKNTGEPATGLTLADINMYLTAVAKANGAETVLWDGTQHPTSELSSLGMYIRQYSGEDLELYEYVAGANYTGATVLDADWVLGMVDALDASEVWTYTTRSLTQGAATIIAAVTGSDIAMYRASYNTATLTGMTTGVDIVEAWFSVKENESDSEDDAWIRISSLSGLERIFGATPAAASAATLTVDAQAGTATIVLKTAAMVLLPPREDMPYDIKYKDSAGETKMWSMGGLFTVEAVVTHATS